MAGCRKDYHSHPFSAPLSHLQIDFNCSAPTHSPKGGEKKKNTQKKPENNPTTFVPNKSVSAKSLTTQRVRRDAGKKGRKRKQAGETGRAQECLLSGMTASQNHTICREKEGEVAGFTGPGIRTCNKGQVKQHYATCSLHQER